MEAKLLTLSHTTTKLIWWQQFFKEIGFNAKKT